MNVVSFCALTACSGCIARGICPMSTVSTGLETINRLEVFRFTCLAAIVSHEIPWYAQAVRPHPP